MYYEEKTIDGVLMWRGTPDGEWQPLHLFDYTERIDALAKERDEAVALLRLVHESMRDGRMVKLDTMTDFLAKIDGKGAI